MAGFEYEVPTGPGSGSLTSNYSHHLPTPGNRWKKWGGISLLVDSVTSKATSLTGGQLPCLSLWLFAQWSWWAGRAFLSTPSPSTSWFHGKELSLHPGAQVLLGMHSWQPVIFISNQEGGEEISMSLRGLENYVVKYFYAFSA